MVDNNHKKAWTHSITTYHNHLYRLQKRDGDNVADDKYSNA
jgi:hypothetical protein